MAVITLKIQPDKESLNSTINEINQSLKKIEGVKLTIDQSGAKAAEGLAAGLQKAASAGSGLSKVIQETETKVNGVLTQTTEKVKTATGEYVQTIKQFGKESAEVAKQTTEVLIHNEQEKVREAQKAAEAERKLRERESQEAEKHRQDQIRRDEKAAQERKKIDEQERELRLEARRRTSELELQAEKELQEQLLEVDRQIAAEIEDVRKQQRTTWKNFLKETAEDEKRVARERSKDAEKAERELTDAKLKQAQAANRQLVKDEEEAQRKRTEAWRAYIEELNRGIEAEEKAERERESAIDKANRLRASYAKLLETIEQIKNDYPEGTFDLIASAAKNQADDLYTLNKEAENYAEKVDNIAKLHTRLQAVFAETRQVEQWRKNNQEAAQEAVKLTTAYDNLIIKIQKLKAQYPEGTFDALEQQVKEARDALTGLDSTTKGYADKVRASKSALDGYNRDLTEIQANTDKVKEATEGAGFSLQNLFRWFVGGRVLSKLTSEIREALQTMKDVDSALVTVQKTTGYSKEQIDDLTESAYSLASAYGRTASEILDAASVYARAGFKDNLEDMTELSALLQNVGDLEGDVAAKFLVATNAAWKLNGSYDDLLRVIDGLNMQTNQAAVDMEALTSGITVAGSVFAGAGESVQTFAGLLGAGVATTQRSGAEIARGLRTILMNVRQIKGELEDGEIVDETTISDAAAALHSVGISVVDANGELRLTSDVLSELAGKWSGLTTAEQSYLSQSLAGKRQANVLSAIMQNWEEAQRQMTLYANGAGSAMQENEIYLNSWEAKTKQLSAAWTEFVSKTVDSDTIKFFLDMGIALVKFADNAGLAVTALGGLYVLFKGKSIVDGVTKSFKDMRDALKGLSGGMTAATTAMGLLTTAISIGIMVYQSFKQAREEAMAKAVSEASDIKELADKYSGLVTQINDETLKRDELQTILKNNVEKYDEEFEKIQDINELRQAGIKLIDDETKARAKQYTLENAGAAKRSERYLESPIAAVVSYKGQLEVMGAEAAKEWLAAKIEELQGVENPTRSQISDLESLSKQYQKVTQDIEDAKAVVEAYNIALSILNGTYESTAEGADDAGNSTNNLNGALDGAKPSVEALQELLKRISDTANTYDTAIGSVIDALDKFGGGSAEVYDAMKALETAIPGSTDKIYDFDTATLTTKEDIFGSKEALLDFIDSQKQLDFSSAISELESVAAAYWDIAGAAVAAMANQQAQAQMAGVLAFTGTGASQAHYDTAQAQLSDLKAQKAEWDAYIAALRTRKDYRGTGSSGGGSGTSSGTSTDYELERLKAIVSLEKAELSFLQTSGKSLDEINAKRKEIQAALHEEAEYLRAQLEVLKAQEVAEEDKAEHEAKIKDLEADILALSTEWWSIQKSINDDLEKAEEERIKQLEEEQKLLEEQKKLQQEMFETLKKTVDEYYAKLISDKEEELTLEEKILAVQKAEDDLAKAQRERTVRYYNAATGQWEWAANQKTVKAAEEALKKAQEDLSKYQRDQAWKEFKEAWEYVAQQIKDGAMTFQEAYDYMYKAMKGIQDKYGVDLSTTLEDSIGGFKDLNYGIDGLTQEVATLLGASVGVLGERLKEYETAVDALKKAFDDAAEQIKSGKMSMEDAYSYLRDRAKEIADKYGIDMTKALDDAIEGMDKTNMSIDELWKSVIINLMKVNSARWFDATDEEKALLHAQNEYLAKLIGATYDPTGYWYLDGTQLYGSQKGVSYETEGYGSRTGSGGGYGIVGTETTGLGGGTVTVGTTTGGGSGASAEFAEIPTVPEIAAEETGETAPGTSTGYGEWDLWQHGPLSELYTGETAPRDGYLHGYFKSTDGQVYSYDTAPEDVLLRHGMYRDPTTGGVSIAPGAFPPQLAGTKPGYTTGSLKEYMERRKQRKSSPEEYTKWQKSIEEGETKRLQLLSSRGGSDDDMLSLGESDLGMTTGSDGLGGVTAASYISGGTVNQYYGNTYQFGDVTMDENKARNTTVYELAELSRTLGKYNGR